jgi:type IV secretory pathway VirB2 component (pilin)
MIVRDIISFVLGNIEIPLFVIAIIVTAFKLRRTRREVMSFSYTLWGELLFYCVGLGFIYIWYMHAFMEQFTAPLIGWQPSPFEWELAWAELGLAVIAILSLWRGYEMRLAASLVFAIFSFGAAAQHIHQIVTQHNYASGNAGLILWFGDIALPIIILVLAWAARDAYERTARRIGI